MYKSFVVLGRSEGGSHGKKIECYGVQPHLHANLLTSFLISVFVLHME